MSNISYEDIKETLNKDQQLSLSESFAIFKWLERNINNGHSNFARDIVIRCLNSKYLFPDNAIQIIFDFVERIGLFPYIDVENYDVSLKTAIHYEFYRSENLPDVILHKKQAEIYHKLINNVSVIISAPTSFGKSLLIEEIVASKKYKNIAIILPTLALVDEIRQNLNKYSDYYKLIFSTKQKFHENNILILTAERFVELGDLPDVDFFVVDEFYKLSDKFEGEERSNVLNHAFYKLIKMTRNFYLLGPNIASIPKNFDVDFECEFIVSNYSTVSSDEILIARDPQNDYKQLIDLLKTLQEPTLIYCQSPAKAEEYTRNLLESSEIELIEDDEHNDVVNWIKKNIHEDWTMAKSLSFGVAFHHGRIPRYLGKYIVKQFNNNKINYLFCTSTLIEGINTVAKNVIVFDRQKGTKRISFFDYSNIKGRSGRMNKYYLGRVFNFYDLPEKFDVHVDFPWFTQDTASEKILIQMADEDLKRNSKERIEDFKNQDILDINTLKANSNISVPGQIALAKEIKDNFRCYHSYLSWSGYPEYDQLKKCCELIWKYLVETTGRLDQISSGAQLTYFVKKYQGTDSMARFIKEILASNQNIESPDKAVQVGMTIIRSWFGFRFPKLLLALERIQNDIFRKFGLTTGEYKFYAARVEAGFCHPILASLEEFGIPNIVAKKIQPYLRNLDEGDLDNVIDQIKKLDFSNVGLDSFEQKILKNFINT